MLLEKLDITFHISHKNTKTHTYIDIYHCIYRIDTCIYHKMRFALLSLMEYINKLGMEYNCWTMNCFMRTWKKFFSKCNRLFLQKNKSYSNSVTV